MAPSSPCWSTKLTSTSSCAQGIRSLAAEYAVKADGAAFVKASTASAYANVSAQVPAIKTLAGKAIASVTALDADTAPPKGCAVVVIDAEVIVLLDVGSKIADNVEAEIAKVRAKLAKSEGNIVKQEELMRKEGWEEKVSEVVRDAEAKKLADAKAAKENYERTVEQFEMLKIKE
jgi:valyl-tRNA synthetase